MLIFYGPIFVVLRLLRSQNYRKLKTYRTTLDCPTFRRNGKVVKGVDLLQAFGFNHGSSHVGGSQSGYHAYEVSDPQSIDLM